VDAEPHFTYHPTLHACIAFAVRLAGSMVLGALGTVLGISWMSGQVHPLLMRMPSILGLAAALAAVMGPLIFLAMRGHGATIDAHGIAGRIPDGTARIAWDDVGTVEYPVNRFTPVLKVTSTDGARRVHAQMLGLPDVYLHARLARFAGLDHAVTRAIAESDN
jgi:hypothetical protein